MEMENCLLMHIQFFYSQHVLNDKINAHSWWTWKTN